jgi:hypothetical protein
MSTQKRKFELFARLQALGFTYEEAVSLRRIEMTLQRWAEHECNGDIQRDEVTDKPYRVYEHSSSAKRYPVADREAGALKRMAAIVAARNLRESPVEVGKPQNDVFAYHQGDCRGCMLYLCTREQLTEKYGDKAGSLLPIDQYYNRGLAVCC